MSQAAAVSSADFDIEVLQSEVPVLVDFWAVWCGPCRRVAPELDAVAEQLSGKAKIVKVNVDEEPELAEKWSVLTVPTTVVVDGSGRVGEVNHGVASEKKLRRQLEGVS